MLLFFFTSALSAPVASEKAVANIVAKHFAATEEHIFVGCDGDWDALQAGVTGWRPRCSQGTLTEVSNWLVSIGSTEIEMRKRDHTTGATYRIKQAERKRFSDPKTVLRTYSVLRPIAVAAMSQSSAERRQEVENYITMALVPAFVPNVPSSLRDLWLAEATAYKTMLASWNPTTETTYSAANLEFGNAAIAAGYMDPMALQWRFRREAEGGPTLVAAYLEVFKDFAWCIGTRHWY